MVRNWVEEGQLLGLFWPNRQKIARKKSNGLGVNCNPRRASQEWESAIPLRQWIKIQACRAIRAEDAEVPPKKTKKKTFPTNLFQTCKKKYLSSMTINEINPSIFLQSDGRRQRRPKNRLLPSQSIPAIKARMREKIGGCERKSSSQERSRGVCVPKLGAHFCFSLYPFGIQGDASWCQNKHKPDRFTEGRWRSRQWDGQHLRQ